VSGLATDSVLPVACPIVWKQRLTRFREGLSKGGIGYDYRVVSIVTFMMWIWPLSAFI
jgi:hypothetical protein